MRWSRTIIEYVPKMRSAPGTPHFLAPHATSIIGKYNYFVLRERLIEARPARVGIELCVRTEELISARSAEIDPFLVIIPIFVLEWRFAQDEELCWCQNPSPLIIGQPYLFSHCKRLDSPSNSRRFGIARLRCGCAQQTNEPYKQRPNRASSH